MDEVLDERKRKILKAIIKTYMETGEPVGSRTISKYPDLNVSCRINEKDALRKFSLASSFLYTRVYFVTVQYLHSYMFHKTVPAE